MSETQEEMLKSHRNYMEGTGKIVVKRMHYLKETKENTVCSREKKVSQREIG